MRPTRTLETILTSLAMVALCVAYVSPVHADDDSVAAPSIEAGSSISETEIARLEHDNSGSAAAKAEVVPTPLKLLAPVPEVLRESQSNRDSDALSVIPLPPDSADDPAPQDVTIDPSKLVFAGTTNEWRVGDAIPGFFNANTIDRCRYRMDPGMVALQRVARKVGFRYLRRYFRSELKEQYRSDPSFSYAEYIDRRNEIGRLGRGEIDTQDLATETFLETTRSEFTGHDQVEHDITLVEWGPFRLDDRGSLTCGLRETPTTGGVQFAGEDSDEKPKGKSIFCGKTYDIDSSIKFRPRVHEALTGGDLEDVLGEVGGKVEVDFLTPILSQRFMTAELELTHKPGRGAGLFVNFVIYLK